MAQFLAELYLSRARPGDLGEVVRRACAVSGSDGGTPVRYLRSIYIPNDETCLHLFDAVSAQELCAACRHAGVRVDRIVEATELLAPEAERTTVAAENTTSTDRRM